MRRSRPGGPLLLLVAALVAPGAARAYPWMIRHGYSGCGVCHVDPSGAGLLTDYGRAQSDLLMATRWSTEKTEEASPTADFGFGLFNLPDWLFLGFSYRGGELIARSTTNNERRPAAEHGHRPALGAHGGGPPGRAPHRPLPRLGNHRLAALSGLGHQRHVQ